MNATRIWALVAGAAILAVLAAGVFLGVQPQLAAAASASNSALSVEAQNQATQIKIAQLSKLAAKTDVMQAQNAVLLKAVPTILKPNTFIRRINTVAALDGVTVAAVTLGDSAAYTPPGASAAGAALALGRTDPSITASNFTSVPAGVQVTGTADAVLQFAHDIQNDERVFSISSVQTTTDETAAVSATFSGYIYVLKR